MYMTIQQILREKNLSRYQLSKKSGVPWATLADICSGKTTLSRCSAGTLMKLSSTLDCLWGELYSAINSNQWSNAITQEQADYLRAKYLF